MGRCGAAGGGVCGAGFAAGFAAGFGAAFTAGFAAGFAAGLAGALATGFGPTAVGYFVQGWFKFGGVEYFKIQGASFFVNGAGLLSK